MKTTDKNRAKDFLCLMLELYKARQQTNKVVRKLKTRLSQPETSAHMP